MKFPIIDSRKVCPIQFIGNIPEKPASFFGETLTRRLDEDRLDEGIGRSSLVTPRELRSRVAAGETQTVEFKSENASAESLADAVVCFANRDGGVILVGVEDDGTITGCTQYHPETLKSVLFNRTVPPVIVRTEAVPIDGKTVIVVDVPESPELHMTSQGRYLFRVGAECRALPPSEIRLLTMRKGGYDTTALPVEEASMADLDPLELARLRETHAKRFPDSDLARLSDGDFLAALNFIHRDGRPRPTVAGLLFAGRPEAIRRHLPRAEVQYVHLDPVGEPDARDDFRLPILQVLDRLLDRIRARNRMVSIPMGLVRVEVWDFPIEVCREAILNAIAHRDYMAPGSIMIRHRADMLEVLSPGPFLQGISPSNILHTPPRHRNPTVSLALQHLGFVERAGVGVDRMYRLMLQHGKEPPVFEGQPNHVRVALRAGPADEAFIRFLHQEQEAGRIIALDQLILLGQLRRHRLLRRSDAAGLIQRPDPEALEVLNGMVDAGLIERVGAGRGTTYRLTARIYEALGERAAFIRDRAVPAERHEELVVQWVQKYGSITNSQCRALCGLTSEQAKYFLRGLVERKLLAKTGQRRTTRYLPGPALTT